MNDFMDDHKGVYAGDGSVCGQVGGVQGHTLSLYGCWNPGTSHEEQCSLVQVILLGIKVLRAIGTNDHIVLFQDLDLPLDITLKKGL